MALSKVDSDLQVNGNLYATTMTLPDASVANANVKANAAIGATKLEHRYKITHDFGIDATAAPSADVYSVIFVAETACTVQFFKAAMVDTGTSTDVSFDLQKASAGSTSYSSILSSTIDITNSTADNTLQVGTVSGASLAAGDSVRVFMDYTSATGATGPFVVLVVDEAAVT